MCCDTFQLIQSRILVVEFFAGYRDKFVLCVLTPRSFFLRMWHPGLRLFTVCGIVELLCTGCGVLNYSIVL